MSGEEPGAAPVLPGLEAGEELRYWAFISYSHRDESWARWLHDALETYRIPAKLWRRASPVGAVPKRLFPVFRDRDELPGAADLGAKLHAALRQSRTLVCICSPRSASSLWVNEEVRFYKGLGREHRVLCLIVDGEPNASDLPGRAAEECFPPAIRHRVGAGGAVSMERVDPIAADVRPGKDGKALALLKLVSGILDVGFDELRQRERQRQRLRRLVQGGAAAALLVLTLGFYVGLADAGLAVPEGERIRRALDHRRLSLFRPLRSPEEIAASAARLRTELGAALLAGRRQDGWINFTLRPGGAVGREVWAHAQTLYALFSAPEHELGVAAAVGLLETPFRPGTLVERDGRRWGWVSHEGDVDVLAEPALWLTAALAAALRSPAVKDAAVKKRLVEHLELTQGVLEAHLAPGEPAGWNMFPDQVDRQRHATYTTSLALLALLELRRADLPWRGSRARRDALLAGAARWLIAQYIDRAAVPGWQTYGKQDAFTTEPYDGLTLQNYALLLQAEAEAGVTLPPALVAAMAPHIARTASRDLSYPVASGEHFARYHAPDGRVVPGKEQIGFLWYPWAIRAGALWLERAEKRGLLPEDRAAVERALGHLVVRLGPPHVKKAGTDWTFIGAETLVGLSAIKTRPGGADR